jgi:SAM-dependent methyltransferase
MSIFSKHKLADLQDYIKLCSEVRLFDLDDQEMNDIMEFSTCRQTDRKPPKIMTDLESMWYESLARGEPNYSIYDHDFYLVELWICWVMCSRKHAITLRRKIDLLPNVNSVVDLGCGFGYTAAGLMEIFPGAKVTGTNLKDTDQFKIAELVGNQYGFKMTEDLAGIGQTDLVFASEYFEHIHNPLAHLDDVITQLRPKYLIVANAFAARNNGHFNEYIAGDRLISNRSIGRLFNGFLRKNGYRQIDTGLWNNRPTYWEKYNGRLT